MTRLSSKDQSRKYRLKKKVEAFNRNVMKCENCTIKKDGSSVMYWCSETDKHCNYALCPKIPK